jgi:hypothetical protein
LKLPESVAKSAKSGRYFSFEKYTTIQLDSPKSNGYMKIPDIEYYGILVLYK